MPFAKALMRPPLRLRALPDRWANWLRAAWILLFGLAVVTVVVSTIYAVRASYWVQPTIEQFGLDFDVTTGARFHPIEILASMILKLAVIAALGAPAQAVLVFEILLNATAMFNHANIRLPAGIDHVLRWLVVTPDMHRVHHSIVPRETNSNFGFNMPWWDRLFGTYRAQPAAGHEAMTIGVEQFRMPCEQRLDRMLTQPFRNDATAERVADGRGAKEP